MKKIITSTVVFLLAAYSLNAQDPSGQSAPSTTTYSTQKPSVTTPVVPTASAKAGQKGVPVSAKFLTMDLSEVYSKYGKALEAQEKFDQAEEAARKEINDMIQEGIKLGEAYKELHTKRLVIQRLQRMQRRNLCKRLNPRLKQSKKSKCRFLNISNKLIKL